MSPIAQAFGFWFRWPPRAIPRPRVPYKSILLVRSAWPATPAWWLPWKDYDRDCLVTWRCANWWSLLYSALQTPIYRWLIARGLWQTEDETGHYYVLGHLTVPWRNRCWLMQHGEGWPPEAWTARQWVTWHRLRLELRYRLWLDRRLAQLEQLTERYLAWLRGYRRRTIRPTDEVTFRKRSE